ncbi:MAG: hypothetical protein KA146_10315 [Leptospiraceae bacterium]|nr:hypothetical protein [Leptospiraceae bacterium]
MITSVDELEQKVFSEMQTRFTHAGELQLALGISQSTARNYYHGLVKTISKENLFEIADSLNIAYRITNQE